MYKFYQYQVQFWVSGDKNDANLDSDYGGEGEKAFVLNATKHAEFKGKFYKYKIALTVP